MKRSVLISASFVAFALIASACGAGFAATNPSAPSTTIPPTTATTPPTTKAPPSNIGGDRLPVQVPGESYGHFSSRLTGVIDRQPNGCWMIDLGAGPQLVVLPAGFVAAPDDAGTFLGPDGTLLTPGMAVDGHGGIAPVETFPDIPDGFWGNYLAYCDRTAASFVVLDSVQPAFEPKAMTEEQLLDMVRTADLAVSWRCGLGFTLSTEDERVALVMYLRDDSVVPDPPISFPHPDWGAKVMVGKNLLANHCDDVFESWEPVPVVASEWELAAGTLTFTPPAEGPCSGGPVAATLTGAAISVGDGLLQLADLSMVNDAYGCFAG